MSPILAATLVLTLLSSNAYVQSSSTPLLTPHDRRPAKGQGSTFNNQLALALQKEKYQFGAIGCNFSDSVCDSNLEYCFNDRAFGKCVSTLITSSEDLFKFNLKRDDVRVLETAMEQLFEKGFRWSHSYTQCILQNLLQTIRESGTRAESDCIEDFVEDRVKEKSDQEATASLEFLRTENDIPDDVKEPKGQTDPGRRVKQQESPSVDLLEKVLEEALQEDYLDLASTSQSAEEDEDSVPPQLSRNSEWSEAPVRETQIDNLDEEEDNFEPKIFGPKYNTPEGFRHGTETRDDLRFLRDSPQESIGQAAESQRISEDWRDSPAKLSPEELAGVALIMGQIEKAARDEALEDKLESEVEAALIKNEPAGERLFVEIPDRDESYAENGLVFLKNPKRFLYESNVNQADDDDEEFDLDFRPDLRPSEFERRERLDVKKPGPWYRTVNNYAFDKRRAEDLKAEPRLSKINPEPEFAGLGPADMKIRDTSGQLSKSKLSQTAKNKAPTSTDHSEEVNQLVNLMKKAGSTAAATKLAQQVPGNELEVIDTSFVTIQLRKKIPSWKVASDLVTLIADFLDLKHSTFQYVRLHDNSIITFKVTPNVQGLTATQVASQIVSENLKPKLEQEMDVSIVSAVAGVKTNPDSPATEPLIMGDEVRNKNLYLGVFAICGVVAVALVASFLFFVLRKSAKSREKLAKLSQDDPAMESCKDYQDLCRARMASKSNEKVEPIRAVQRVQSNVSEGGTSSSRSSTSSWSEEPVLTNMDISTGHMVLSYMEDHLKKKDRLDQEWAALCNYEADPGSTSIAEKADNQKKNRYTNSLPYDHSRVILNDLANINGADYINASTITDHDPRNPAYIATQGPLPTTAADFWQMVWEQGSVVIVTLTKLTENGTPLCHRYWPEEGSELHHIYEVHLVSEHIWCDEYLVRSFYLKNLKTGETRTVTQFHFLAWPENGIPTSAKSILEFRRKVNKSYRGRSCPIIVHCSDGAGRTGTYSLIDMVLNRMTKGAKEIDIAASLEHIRDQRPGMVRTKQQFEFVLMAVAEEVHAILKALPQ